MQWINEKWNNIKKWIKNNGLENREESILLWSCFQSICLQIIYIASSFSIWMSLESILLPVLQRVTDSTISKLHMEWVICATLLVTLLFFIYFVKKVINKCRVSKWFLSNLILISLIYTRYRNYSDEFVFWGCNKFYYLDLLYAILIVLLVYSCFTYIIPLLISLCIGKRDKENYLLRDDEIDDPDKDLLGYDKQVKNLSHLLETVDVRKRAYSVGIVGEWGVGKSSFLKLFSKHITEQGDIVIRFNPRHAKSTSFIQEDFFNQLRAELGKYSGNIGTRIDKYAYALQLTTPTKWFYAIWDLFTNWTADIEKQRINEVMRSLNRYIYIFIEDLDRLTGAEILEVLKLIDANGNFCNTFFLTAYDKHYVNGILKRTLKLDNDSTDYTDKYFHYEFLLSQPQINQLARLMDKLIYDWALSIVPIKDKKNLKEEWVYVRRYLLNNLPTIRQIKRYTNLLRSSYRFVKDNVVFSDFALITLVRFIDIITYRSIYNRKFISNREKFMTFDYYLLNQDYKEISKCVTKIQNFDDILGFLFNTNGIRLSQEYNRIYRVESFENYFYDKLISSNIEQLLRNSQLTIDESIKRLEDILKDKNFHSDVIEYLCLCDPEWIENKERLFLYLCFLIYADAICKHNRLFSHLKQHLFHKQCQIYINKSIVKTISEYNEIIYDTFDYMIRFVPYAVGYLMIKRLEGRHKYEYDEKQTCLNTKDEITLALKAQFQYDNLYGTDQWNALDSLEIAQISDKPNRVLLPPANEQLITMLNLHADEYAAAILNVYSNSSENSQNKYSWVEAPKIHTLISNMRGHEEFKEWLGRIQSEDLRYIMNKLYAELLENNEAILKISYVTSKDDYALIAEKIKFIKTVVEP